jgi:hypothetical protein
MYDDWSIIKLLKDTVSSAMVSLHFVKKGEKSATVVFWEFGAVWSGR